MGFKATQSLHRLKNMGFKATQSLHRFKMKGFQATKLENREWSIIITLIDPFFMNRAHHRQI